MNSLDIKIQTKQTGNVPEYGPSFDALLRHEKIELARGKLTQLQINLGKLCNLACHHCHVDAGPKRTEIMTWECMQKILDWISKSTISEADLTGGAPELNPHFRQFCDALIKMGVQITSRCNITVLFEPGQEDLAEFYAKRKIRLVCSLPCYTEDNVDAQRGRGVFDKSIAGLQLLNSVGYGISEDLPLDLVYNPGGAFLPPPQAQLEQDYRDMLATEFNIQFSSLLAITNLPVNRFAHALRRDNELESYQNLLVDNFNAATVDSLMCRQLINLDWLGRVYDCDFNQMLDMPIRLDIPKGKSDRVTYLWDLPTSSLEGNPIATDRHCFGCTAGAGSSCSGTLA
ncbi:MAG: arsenosugar biosynthesis radical SAM (seleno)protein ArsS [Pseudomonadota bacterium]